MSEHIWDLAEIDPDTRAQAEEEAARLGVSLSDYLTDMLLRSALAEQVTEVGASATTVPSSELAAPEPFALRHRLKSTNHPHRRWHDRQDRPQHGQRHRGQQD